MANRLRHIFLMLLWIAPLAFNPACVYAEQAVSRGFNGIEELIQLLKEKNVITDKEASKFIERYRENPPVGKESGKVIKIIPDEDQNAYFDQVTKEVSAKIQQEVKQDLNKDVKKVKDDLDYMSDELLRRSRVLRKDLDDLNEKVTGDMADKFYKSSWTQRIRWGGDIRIRYQRDYFEPGNAFLFSPDGPPFDPINTTVDRSRGRIRVRLGIEATVMEKDPDQNFGKVDVGVRLATGNEEDPISTNDTLGDYFNKDGIVLDRAYLKWTYQPDLPVMGKLPRVSISAGRIANPWYHTDLVWDSDLNFEGIALNLLTDTRMANPLRGFFTVGLFPLQEEELAQRDKWLYGIQGGVEYKKAMGLSAKLGIAYYDYRHIDGEENEPFLKTKDYTAPQYFKNSNSVWNIANNPLNPWERLAALASDYNILNITGELDYDYWFPIHIILKADFAKNIGYEKEKVFERTGFDIEETLGYQVGLTVGYPKVMGFGEWNLSLAYKYLEADAVLDAFTDSDFHGGGTNAKGWVLKGELGLHRNLWLSARWLTADEIEGDPLSIDVLQLDLNASY